MSDFKFDGKIIGKCHGFFDRKTITFQAKDGNDMYNGELSYTPGVTKDSLTLEIDGTLLFYY